MRQVDYQEMDSNDGEMEVEAETCGSIEQTLVMGSSAEPDSCEEQMECSDTETEVKKAMKSRSKHQKFQRSRVSKEGGRTISKPKTASKTQSMSKGKGKKRKIVFDEIDSDFETTQRQEEEADSDKSDGVVRKQKRHCSLNFQQDAQKKKPGHESNFRQSDKSIGVAVDGMTG